MLSLASNSTSPTKGTFTETSNIRKEILEMVNQLITWLQCQAKKIIIFIIIIFLIGKMQITSLTSTDARHCSFFSGCGLQLKVVSGMENQQTNTVELKTGKVLTSSKVRKWGEMFCRDKVNHLSHDICCSTRNTCTEYWKCHKIERFAKICENQKCYEQQRIQPQDLQNKKRSAMISTGDGAAGA